jgi:predicted anti-sigma-YlaC factor YlaD
MECKDVAYNIVDFIDEQLLPEKAAIIKKHISSCSECKIIYDETVVLMRDFENEKMQTPSPNLRANFFAMLEEEKQLQEPKVVQLKPESSFNWKYAFQIAASFVLLCLGFFAGSFSTKQNTNKEIATLKTQTVELKENMMLALLDNNSPSKRIQAVNYSEELEQPDKKNNNSSHKQNAI